MDTAKAHAPDQRGVTVGDERVFSRRDLFISAACFLAGSTALAGITMSADTIHEASAEELLKAPEKFVGSCVQTECTLEPNGTGTLEYAASGIRAASFSPSSGAGLLSESSYLFRMKGLSSDNFRVAVAMHETTPIVGERVRIMGIMTEASLEGKRVYVLIPRVAELAPLPFPVVPF